MTFLKLLSDVMLDAELKFSLEKWCSITVMPLQNET